jgi:ABC-2 type transport system permease protein
MRVDRVDVSAFLTAGARAVEANLCESRGRGYRAGNLSPFSEIRLIVQRELRKNLRSVKGIILFAISLLGASVTMFNLKAFEVEAPLRFKDATPELIHDAKAAAIQEFFYSDSEVANHLADAPLKLVLIFFLAVWLAPMLVALMGFDTVSSDMQYRSVRYWTVRTRRTSFLIGKFVGM